MSPTHDAPRLTWRRLERIVPYGCALFLAVLVVGVHAWQYPDFSSFWVGVDQQRYLHSARAWAALNFSPDEHHYPAGYALLGALFVRLTSRQPFLVPDLCCLEASLFLFVAIGRRLAPRWSSAATAVCFVLAVCSGRQMVSLWVVPWSTTGTAPFQFGAVLLALRFGERPTALRAFVVAACIGAAGSVRPSDAAVLLVSAGLYGGWVLLRDRASWRRWAWSLTAAASGLLLGVMPELIGHLAVFGWSPGTYVGFSAAVGFEWRLLPMRWVTLVIDPRPLLPEGAGIVEVLPWVAPGVAGMILSVFPRPNTRVSGMVFVAATVMLHWALYLAYRDLQPYGLWRFYNIHYFKWTFPFLVLWAAQFFAALYWAPERSRAAASAVLALSLLVWRPVLRKPAVIQVTENSGALALPGLAPLDRAVLLPLIPTAMKNGHTDLAAEGAAASAGPVRDAWRELYFGAFDLRIGDRLFSNTRDFKVLPVPAGALLLPLRPLPAGAATLVLPDGIGLDTSAQSRVFRQGIVLGIPWALFRHGVIETTTKH